MLRAPIAHYISPHAAYVKRSESHKIRSSLSSHLKPPIHQTNERFPQLQKPNRSTILSYRFGEIKKIKQSYGKKK